MAEDPIQQEAAFSDHLRELSRRLRASLIVVILACILSYFFSEWLFDVLTRPLMAAGAESLHFKTPVEPFFTYIKVAVVAGIILSGPFVLYEVWAFVAPALYPEERELALPFIIFTILFFFGGVAFGYFVVLPYGFDFLMGYAQKAAANFSITQTVAQWLDVAVNWRALGTPATGIEPTIMMDDYLSLVTKLLLAFGLVFELPTFVFFLTKIHLVTYKSLLRFAKFFVVIAFLVAAILTPPDVFTQFLMAVPLLAMYALSILVAYVFGDKTPPENESADPLDELDDSLPEDKWTDQEP